ncbi:MAG: hypothetical protein JKX72_05075 [Robiginitomaculum sp.]|nr:hypothetical protein [Robiginitomaculum sp.]
MVNLKKFINDIGGGFAIPFAGASLVIMVAFGAALDINQAHKANSYLQDLTDGAALIAALDKDSDQAKKKEIAKTYIKAAFETNYKLKVLKVKLKQKKNGAVKVTTIAHLETMMMGIIGKDTIKVKVTSVVNQSASDNPVEIAFVLDTTASMNAFGAQWSKVVDALETLMIDMAANGGSGADEFRASLIPYADRVRIGNKKLKGIPILSECANSREENIGGNAHKLTNKTPKEVPFTGGYGGWGCPSEAVTFPTNDIKSMVQSLNNINPAGTGRFDVGLAWGYRLLSNKWRPIIGGGNWPKQKKVTKVAVFLTDGYSTIYEYEVGPVVDPQPWGWNKGTPEGFTNVLDVCTQMKNEDIVIHVIAVNMNVHFKPYLEKCATDLDHYHSVSDASDVVNAIGKIGKQTSVLRVSH